MDAKQVLLCVTDQDVIDILYKLGSDVSDRSNEEYLIFNTSVCHGGENYKLYYYRNTKSFYCYSGCGVIRDIFDLIRQSLDISFEESVKYVINELGLNSKIAKRGFPVQHKSESKKQNLNDIELEILPPIEKPYLYYAYPNIPIVQWLKNNISKEAMQTFNIRYCTKSNAAIIPHFNIKSETVGIRVRAFSQDEIENYGKYHPLYYGGEGCAHPLGKNLYGLHKTKGAIKKYKKVVVGESEKFVLQFETYYKENNISVALCGSSFSKYQMKMLLDLGVEEFILALDKEYKTTEEETIYLKKIYKKVKILLDNNIKVTLIWDEINGLLGYKDSPTDKGKYTYEKLVKNRRNIKEIMNEKYKLKPQYEDILETILKNRDLTIEQANEILNPPEDCIQDPMDMKNMKLAIDKLKYHIDNNSKIGTLVDVDVDGYCSSSMIYNLILNQLEYKNIIYILQNKNKTHGLEESVVEDIIKSEIDLLIIPDAGCSHNDGIKQEQLINLGIDIIILDHHIVECRNIEGVTIVNPNQEGDNTNKNLSGAGVTYKFVQAFCKKYYPNIDHTQYIDLFALSLISDCCDMRKLENRMYYNVGSSMEYIQNPLILEYINNKNLEGDYLTIEQLGFSIAPYINSVIRLGNKQERELLFIAMADQRLVKSNKRGCFGQMALASEEAVRVSNNMKSKQDKQKKDGAFKVLKRIEEQSLLDNKVIICDVTDILSPSLTGLAANTILNEIKRPLILLRTNDGEKYTGSARNYGDAIIDFKEFCKETKLFNFCSGHPGAFGVEIIKDNLNVANETFNKLLCDVDFESAIEIDGLYDGKVPMEDIQTVADCQELWCHSIKEPQFLVRGIKIHTKDIQKVGIANYKFMYNGCYFIKNYGSKVWYENFSNPGNKLPFGGELNVEVLCRFRKTHTWFYYIDIIDANSSI